MELFEESLFLLRDSNPDIPGHILIATLATLSRLSLSRIISEDEVVRVHAMKCYVTVEAQLHSFFPSALSEMSPQVHTLVLSSSWKTPGFRTNKGLVGPKGLCGNSGEGKNLRLLP
jgi:hypothetical protein